MAGGRQSSSQESALVRATALVTEALDLVDGYGGPPEASAHLEMALVRLRAATRSSRDGSRSDH